MRRTNYKKAVEFIKNKVFIPNLDEIDPSVLDCYDRNGEEVTVYQYFVTDCDENDIERLEKAFPDLLFVYSEMLRCYVLCVDHVGTPWSSVDIDCYNDEINLD